MNERQKRLMGTMILIAVAAFFVGRLTAGGDDGDDEALLAAESALAAVEELLADLQTTTTTVASTTTAVPAPDTTAAPEETPTTDASDGDLDTVDLEVLTRDYAWMESSAAVMALQEQLGIDADGVYGSQTRRAHHDAMVAADLPTDGLPDCVPRVKADRSLLGIQIGTSMDGTIDLMDRTCGPRFVQEGEGTDDDRWMNPCSSDHETTTDMWFVGEATLVLSLVRAGDTAWFIGWTTNGEVTFPGGVTLGMATGEVLDRLRLDPADVETIEERYPGMGFDEYDEVIVWGASPSWSDNSPIPAFGGHGLPYNASELEFTDDVLSGWNVSPYTLCH